MIQKVDPGQLAAEYLDMRLPEPAQSAIVSFMECYGMRGPGELDIGRPRWREDPKAIMQILKSYVAIEDPTLAPDKVFARGEAAAQEAFANLELALKNTKFGVIKARVARWSFRRYRALGGLREMPKFYIIQLMGMIKAGLMLSGQELAADGLLNEPDDLFYCTIDELDAAAEAGAKGRKQGESAITALQPIIRERREKQKRESKRKQLPRVLLSDGYAYYEGIRAGVSEGGDGKLIAGDPVSPGVVEGHVRVIHHPQDAGLKPGEILVCQGTDPAWTPLFLAAGGLVMEVGGMVTHGSIVAREYGIPAVVGVHLATERLKTGMRIRIDGSSGRIKILENDGQ